MISLSLPRSRKTCGWSKGGLAPTHMNSCEPISMTGTPASLWKCGTTLSDIGITLMARAADAIKLAATVKCRAPYRRVEPIASRSESRIRNRPTLISACKFDTILSPWRSPSFVGSVVSENRHTMSCRVTFAITAVFPCMEEQGKIGPTLHLGAAGPGIDCDGASRRFFVSGECDATARRKSLIKQVKDLGLIR